MRFYTQQHKHYCGIDLHTKMMYVCIIDREDNILLHKNIPTDPLKFLALIAPYREDLVVGVECIFSWYWLADLCTEEGIEFLLGHALYMKAIHGGKTKNDKIDSLKIAKLLKGGNFPMAYVYPNFMRATRDLLRRRMYFVHFRSEVQAHIQLTNYQYNLPAFEKKLERKSNRVDIAERFRDPVVSKNVESDLSTMDHFEALIKGLEAYIVRYAKAFDTRTYYRLKTVPGIGKVLALVILFEIQEIKRFPTVGAFCSYARLVKCPKESAGKRYGYSGSKIGNAHLKWAFSEATILFMRESQRAKDFVAKMTKKHGKGKAISILAHKLGRAVYFVWKRQDSFDEKYFFQV
ncbi:IS110 family transposase [Nitrospira defluvii]|nr:IS110 family transposase [Nitrospira defluvii]